MENLSAYKLISIKYTHTDKYIGAYTHFFPWQAMNSLISNITLHQNSQI